jgi:hypothetical protein
LLFLPAAGYRLSSGSQFGVGNIGSYWSSTVKGTSSHNLYFYSTVVSQNNYDVRAFGLSLRCVAELN